MSELIASLEAELTQVREDRTSLADRLAKVDELERYYRAQTEKFEREIDQQRDDAVAETEALLDSTRKELEKLVAEIRSGQAEAATVKKAHKFIRETSSRANGMRKRKRGKPERLDQFSPGNRVRIVSLNQEGDLTELIGDDRARVRVAELAHLERGGEERRQAEQVMVAGDAGENRPVDLLPERILGGAADDDAALRAEIRLVGGRGHEVRPLAQRVLEEAACDETQDVRAVVEQDRADVRAGRLEFLDRLGEEEERATEHDEAGALALDQIPRRRGVEPETVLADRKREDLVGVFAERAELRVADVAATGDSVGERRAALLEDRAEGGLVGHGRAGQADVHAGRPEDLPDEAGGALLDLIDVLRTFVVTVARVPFGVPVVEVGVEQASSRARQDVLAGDEIDGFAPPCVARPADARDVAKFL